MRMSENPHVIKTIEKGGRTFEVMQISDTLRNGKPAPEPVYRGFVKGKIGFQPFEVFESYFADKKPLNKAEIDGIIIETLKALAAKDPERFWLEVEIEKHIAPERAHAVQRYGTPAFIARAAKLARQGTIESSHIETKAYEKVNTYRFKVADNK